LEIFQDVMDAFMVDNIHAVHAHIRLLLMMDAIRRNYWEAQVKRLTDFLKLNRESKTLL
jgi:hypothetical protein